MQNKPFNDLMVVELASVLAGPAAGMFFAELGARVIKVENKSAGGDVTRTWKLPVEDPGAPESAYYNGVNWGKESLMIDLADEADRAHILSLIEKADVLLANFKRGSAEKLGLDHRSLGKLNPSLIYANLSAYGEESDKAGYDVLLQAETGYLDMTGHPGGPPAKLPVALIDILAAHQLKEAVLIALFERERTGKGSYVTVSLVHSAIASLANQASNYLNAGFIPGKMGSRHPNICPYGDIFKTADGCEIVLAIGSDEQFAKLCDVLSLADLSSDPRFATNTARVMHSESLIPQLSQAVSRFQGHKLLEILDSLTIPAGRLHNMKDVFESPTGKEMILNNENGSRCVSTVAFNISPR